MTESILTMKVSNLASTLTLKEKRAAVKELNALIKTEIAKAKVDRQTAKEARLAKAFERRENSIAKAKARLEKLMDKTNPVGTKAVKANRKPGKVTTVVAKA